MNRYVPTDKPETEITRGILPIAIGPQPWDYIDGKPII